MIVLWLTLCTQDTGVSKGFGFVSYDNVMSAALALQSLNGYNMGGGRKLRIEMRNETAQNRR